MKCKADGEKCSCFENMAFYFIRYPWLVVVVAGAFLSAAIFYPITNHSPVYNEAGRLASGIIHCRNADFMTFTVNPPLPRMVATLPTALGNA